MRSAFSTHRVPLSVDSRRIQGRFINRADEATAKTRRVAPAEPTLPAKLLIVNKAQVGGEGGIRTHVPLADKTLSRRPRYDHFGTSPYSIVDPGLAARRCPAGPQAAAGTRNCSILPVYGPGGGEPRSALLAAGHRPIYRRTWPHTRPMRAPWARAARQCSPSPSAAWACPGMYGAADEAESIATIHAALDAGITLLDTGDFYGIGHNELLIGRALRGPPRPRAALGEVRRAARARTAAGSASTRGPAAVKNFLGYSLHAARRRPHRHLPPGAARSQRADRGHDRRASPTS